MGLAQINIRFKADLSVFSTEMQNVSRKMQTLGTKMNEMGKSLSLYVTGPLLAGGAAAIKFASDYEESLNKVNVAFGPASESVKAFAKTSLQSFGIAEGSALDAAAMYGDMATSMGLPQNAAAKMSTSLVGLAGDLASFKNIGIDQANTALAGIFTGETESLKKLGIVMTEANLQSFALSKGIKTQVKDMDQASKVNLRYAYIMANTTNAQGDFVRTGGGAANQMRVFQESLKQLAQQFGAVILPAFTKLITFVNGLIKGFGNLSPATKTLIVGVAGVAAAIGPLMVGLGNLIGIIPRLIVQFNALKATIIANPYMALATAILAVGTAIYFYVSSTEKAVSAKTALNNAVAQGTKNAVEEVASLDRLYASATNVKLSIDERKKAVDQIQAQYPGYFKNIGDEVILNGKATTAYNELREAIFNKSRAMAVDGELQNRANARVEKEIQLREEIARTEAEIAKIKKGANTIVLQEANAIEKTQRITISKNEYLKAQTQLLANQNAKLKKFNEDNLKADQVLLNAKEEFAAKSSKLQEDEINNLENVVIGTDAVKAANEKLIKTGTVAFYESQIDGLKKLQKEQVTTNQQWLDYQNKIDSIQKKIDALTDTKVVLPKPEQDYGDVTAPPTFALADLKDQKSYYENLREQFSTTSEEYAKFSELVNNTQIKINAIEGAGAVVSDLKAIGDEASLLNEKAQLISAGVADAFSSLAGNLVGSLGLAKDGFQGFIGGLLQTVTKLIAMMLASSISQAISGATASGTSTGPAAVFTTPAFIATAVSGVLAAFAAIPKFAEGGITSGIIGGTSYYGDKILARVNSGEMIANNRQQKAIWGAMNSGSNVNIDLGGSFVLRGQDLELAVERVLAKKKRLG